MKKLIAVVTFLFVVGTGLYIFRQQFVAYTNTVFYYLPCEKPIVYKIGSIDSRFNLTESELQDAISKAANIWNNVERKSLFALDEQNGDLVIGLVYDNRQFLTSQISSKEQVIKNKQSSLNTQIQQYEDQVADFKKRVAALNQTIQSWNNQGGAPKEEFDKILAQQQALQSEGDSLNARARELNLSAQDYNLNVGDLNQTIDTFNNAIARKPEEGLYNAKDKTITIYFSNTNAELVHTLAHELGHARGLNHNQSEGSIMFPFTTEALTPSAQDIAALQEICRKRSVLELLQERIKLIVQRFKTSQQASQ